MRKLYDRLNAVLTVFAATLTLLLMGVVVVGIFYRYVVDASLSWYDEFAGYLLVWLTMYGSVVALARGKHIGFETLVEKMPAVPRRVVEIFSVLCVMGFSAVVMVTGWQLVQEMGGETAVSIPWVKMSWVYSVMPISGGLMLLVGLAQLVVLLHPAAASGATEIAASKPMQEAQ